MVAHALRLLSRNGRSVRAVVQVCKPVWLKALLHPHLIVGVDKYQNLRRAQRLENPIPSRKMA